MKQWILMILCLVFSSIAYAADFSDVPGHKYGDSVRYLQNRGVVQGYDDGSFGIDRSLSRAEMMKIVLEASTGAIDQMHQMQDCFDDVHDERYAPYVCYAVDQGMVKGVGDGRFDPDRPVTMVEGLKIALNAFGGYDLEEGKGDQRYVPFLEFVHNNNIFSKYAVYPDKAMTRGQMAYLTHQLMLEREDVIRFTGKRESGSLGCGQMTPRTTPTESTINGVVRHYITDVGSRYDNDEPTPLIIAFHGRTNSNSEVRNYYKLDRTTKGDAIVVYPLGLPERGPSRNWQNGGDRANNLRDFALFDQLVKEFSENYCIDMDQIYVIGHSLGAWFTNTLACARGDVIRGMGSVGGSMTRNDCTGPVAAMIMHHPADNLASFAGGEAARDWLLQQNRCNTNSAVPVQGATSKSNCVQYTCMADAPVVWCPHTEDDTRGYYYPHTWPSFATPMIWNFWQDL